MLVLRTTYILWYTQSELCSYLLFVLGYGSSIRAATVDEKIVVNLLGMRWLLCDCVRNWVKMSSQTMGSSSTLRLWAVNPDAVLTDWTDHMDWCRTVEVMLQIMGCEGALTRATDPTAFYVSFNGQSCRVKRVPCLVATERKLLLYRFHGHGCWAFTSCSDTHRELIALRVRGNVRFDRARGDLLHGRNTICDCFDDCFGVLDICVWPFCHLDIELRRQVAHRPATNLRPIQQVSGAVQWDCL